MENTIIMELPNAPKISLEVRNELTNFLDRYNISLLLMDDDVYRDLHKTYIYIDKYDIRFLLNNIDLFYVLSFRTPGATRGGIHIREIERNKDKETNITTIEYEITNISFIESSCFRILKTYRREVIEASKNKFIGSKLIIKIQE